MSTLYERLGGEPAVEAAVDVFYRKVLADDVINKFFDGVSMSDQRAKQKAFLTMAFGGPNHYTGKDLRAAHARLRTEGLSGIHFDHVIKHLRDTLIELGVGSGEVDEVIEIAQSTRSDVLAVH
jgi:hemoglobin